MKELSIEEKAKRYDEAIKVAKSNYETIVQMDNDCTFAKEGIINTFHHMFPELAESEDEKIRKELIKEAKGSEVRLFETVTNDEFIAWLEKQGDKDKFIKKELGCIKGYREKAIKRLEELEKQEQKPFDFEHANIPQRDFVPKSAIEASKEEKVDNANKVEPNDYSSVDPHYFKPANIRTTGYWHVEDVEQKPAEEYNITGISSKKSQGKLGEIIKNLKATWSEEDEVGLANAMWAIEQARTIAKDENDMGNLWYAERWLKSIKDRTQPKQEWSEEDKGYIDTLIGILNERMNCSDEGTMVYNVYKRAQDWLKSLKPQNRWKPSDEQMEALKGVVQEGVFRFGLLESLYQDLKKLREE